MPKKSSPADQFSDDEMEQMKRYGMASLGGTSDSHLDSPAFSEGVQNELDKLDRQEANAAKMKAAQTGGGDIGMGPSDMDQAQVKQRGSMQKQADVQDAQQAAQAQGSQAPLVAPAAPSGPAGDTSTYPAQKGAVGGGGNAQQPGQTPPPPQGPPPGPGGPPPSGPPPEGEEEEDPAAQFPP